MLTVGDPIPDFELPSQEGIVRSVDLRGKRFVLYFYPADDTPGCTKEACGFRDRLPDFQALGVPVFGVSPQDVNSKQRFAEKHSLAFPLLADTDHKVAESFGAWGEKSMYGKKYMGILRTTFVVGPDGRVEQVWEKVKPEGHAEEVYRWLNPAAQPADSPKPVAKKKASKS